MPALSHLEFTLSKLFSINRGVLQRDIRALFIMRLNYILKQSNQTHGIYRHLWTWKLYCQI